MGGNTIKTAFMEAFLLLVKKLLLHENPSQPHERLFPKERLHNGLKIKRSFSPHKTSWVKTA